MKRDNYRYTRFKKLSQTCAQFFALSMVLLFGHLAQADEVNTGWFSDVAIEGYDPVAYFTENRPVKGSKKHSFRWRDARWLFATAENRQKFAENPERYAPQYGGFCAWAVAHGDRAGIDPEQFTVHEGRLYLNYNARIQEQWTEDKSALIEAADDYWPKMQ